MITRKYKTLNGLFNGLGFRQFTYNDYKRKSKWVSSLCKEVRFELSDELDEEVRMLLASGLCSTKPAIRKYADLMRFGLERSYGILDRLWIARASDGKFYGQYCAGQDYISETRYIQSILR